MVIETRVAGGAGLSFSTWRQRLGSGNTLETDLRLHPLIHDLRLKSHTDGRMWKTSRAVGAERDWWGGGVRTHLPLAVTGRVDLEIVLAGAWRSVLTLS